MSFGCSASQNDAEIMAGLLSRSGFLIVENKDIADLVVLNTCIVKGQTEAHMIRLMKELSSLGKKTIVTGCMPEGELNLIEETFAEASIVSTHNIIDIVDAVKKTLEGKRVVFVGVSRKEKLDLPKISKNPAINIVQINDGCMGHCTYCIVKKVKPVLNSYSMRRIVKTVEHAVKTGCKEIWITSQDTAAYGYERSGKSELPELLNEIINIPGKFFVRVGMMNPDTIAPVFDEFLKVLQSPKMFKFIHIPVQAGSDKVLKDMHRKYKAELFAELVQRAREKIPKITISTDIICGFPGETDNEFKKTLKLVRKTKPSVINRSRFTPRPGTKAAEMKQTPSSVGKERTRTLAEMFKLMSEEENKDWMGWEGEVIVDDKTVKGLMGRNEFYKPIAIETKEKIKLGKIVKIKIIKTQKFHLTGELKE